MARARLGRTPRSSPGGGVAVVHRGVSWTSGPGPALRQQASRLLGTVPPTAYGGQRARHVAASEAYPLTQLPTTTGEHLMLSEPDGSSATIAEYQCTRVIDSRFPST